MAKPAQDPDAPGVVKTTTIREVLPTGLSGKTPEFFEFVRSIPDAEIGKYTIYLYRTEPGRVPIDHTIGKTFNVPGYGLLPVVDLEAIEAVVASDCGGGIYKLMCRRRNDGEMQATKEFRIDLAPREITPWYVRRGEKPNADGKAEVRSNTGGDGAAAVAAKGFDTVAGLQTQMMTPMMDMMRTASSVVREFATHPQASVQDEFTRKFQEIMMTRAMADPLETLKGLMLFQQTMRETQRPAENNLDSIRSWIAFAKELSGGGAPAVSAGAEIARAVPGMISTIVDGIRELRIKSEADRDTVAIMHSHPQPRPMPPQALPPAARLVGSDGRPIGQTMPTPPPAPPASSPAPGQPPLEFVEQKIIEIFRRPGSAEDAASATIEFLETMSGDDPPPERDIVLQLANLGEVGLTSMFQQRPNLRPALNNIGRLQDFIRAFLRYHAEDVAADSRRPN